mmetsp:Transcript_23933/g.68501  ORF Transcript_23933/g.68501 Transcript_23933/m.68501 type:complete len:225 (-) Transcript_23933:1110-1784(-)
MDLCEAQLLERERRGPRCAARAQDEAHAAARSLLELRRQLPPDADPVRVVAPELARPGLLGHRVDCANLAGRLTQLVHVLKKLLLVRDGHGAAPCGNEGQLPEHVFNAWRIVAAEYVWHPVDAEARILDRRRSRQGNWVAENEEVPPGVQQRKLRAALRQFAHGQDPRHFFAGQRRATCRSQHAVEQGAQPALLTAQSQRHLHLCMLLRDPVRHAPGLERLLHC